MSKEFETLMAEMDAERAQPIRGFLKRRSFMGHNIHFLVFNPIKGVKTVYRGARADVRNRYGRVKNNFGRSDIWSFHYVNAQAQIKALTALKNGIGYPSEFVDNGGPEAWYAVVDQMIDGFQAAVDIDDIPYENWDQFQKLNDECQARIEAGFAVYAKHYLNLWD